MPCRPCACRPGGLARGLARAPPTHSRARPAAPRLPTPPASLPPLRPVSFPCQAGQALPSGGIRKSHVSLPHRGQPHAQARLTRGGDTPAPSRALTCAGAVPSLETAPGLPPDAARRHPWHPALPAGGATLLSPPPPAPPHVLQCTLVPSSRLSTQIRPPPNVAHTALSSSTQTVFSHAHPHAFPPIGPLRQQRPAIHPLASLPSVCLHPTSPRHCALSHAAAPARLRLCPVPAPHRSPAPARPLRALAPQPCRRTVSPIPSCLPGSAIFDFSRSISARAQIAP